MGKTPAFQFYPGDWFREPGLRASSVAAKGAWAQILFSMHDARERGKLSGDLRFWGNLIGVKSWGEWEQHGSYSCSPWTAGSESSVESALELIRELVRHEVCEIEFRDEISRQIFADAYEGPEGSVTERNFFITMINRRMYREFLERERNRKKQQNYRDRHPPQDPEPKDNHSAVPQDNQKVTSYSSSSSSISLKKNKYSFVRTSVEYGLSELLFQKIRERKPDFKTPNLDGWAWYVSMMIRRDGRDPTTIRKVIEWCQQDEFWQNNILSTEKMRKQFDQLEMKMNSKYESKYI